MIEVRLHGALGRDFGRVWNLEAQTTGEVIRAIEVAKRGFMAAIQRLSASGIVFRVTSGNHDYTEGDLATTFGRRKRLDIIPIVRGASAVARFVVGVALIAAALYTMQPGVAISGWQAIGLSVGTSLALGAVTQWLTPKVSYEENKKRQSWTFDGPTNTADQGTPVPIIYGEVLTGSVTVSAGITVDEIAPNGSTNPYVQIGGNLNPVTYSPDTAKDTVSTKLSVGIYNLAEPLFYTWSYSGFTGAVAVRLKTDGPSATLEVDINPVAGQDVSLTGTVSVQVNGKWADGGGGEMQSKTVTGTATIKATVSYYEPTQGS